jgi:hypothetical protein
MSPGSSRSVLRSRATRDELVRVPMLLQDRQYLIDDSAGGVDFVVPGFLVVIADGHVHDGPASDRVAVVDLDEGSRPTRPPARVLPPKGAKRIRSFAFDEELLDPDRRDALRFEDDTFVQLHVFAGVHATLAFFEDLLGRRVAWAFGEERLEVLPWAGTGRDAFYERASGSIKFFEYETVEGRRILTALSRDIVAHEAAHAILDAVAPDLNDAADPDSLTIHESIGDLSALLQTLVDENMLFSAYALFGGDVDGLEALGRLAEEFGTDVRRGDGAAALRSASTDATFRTGKEPGPAVDRTDPHDASSVVVGALFAALRERVAASARDFERATLTAARELTRIVIPALNRLPPGEVSLWDFARALDSAAQETGSGPAWMTAIDRQLVDRGVADDPASLRAPTPSPEPLTGWPGAADEVVEANRDRLAVPDDASPVATSVEFSDRGWTKTPRRRVQIRVAWDVDEIHDVGYGLSDSWSFRVGTTAVVDADTGAPISILTGSATEGEAWARRHAQLLRWAATGLLLAKAHPSNALLAIAGDHSQRVVGTARTLHLLRPNAPEDDEEKGAPDE